MDDETQPIEPLPQETYLGSFEPAATSTWNANPEGNKKIETTRRFYIFLLGLITLASLVAIIILVLDDPTIDIAAVAVIGGVAVGALASLSANDRRQ